MASLVVGLTGGIGSGKTAASDWFAAQGVARRDEIEPLPTRTDRTIPPPDEGEET